jgi:hypothetical protein
MPTINPRINVTLSPSLYAMVGELAKHQRVSRSMVLRELLEASEPALSQVVVMLRAAADMGEAARERLQQDMGETITSMENKADQALALAAGMTADLVAQAESIRGRRPGVGKRSAARSRTAASVSSSSTHGGKRPPSSNRGVKSSHTATKTIAQSPDSSKENTAKHRVKTKGGQPS